MTPAERRRWWRELLQSRPIFQFGQPSAGTESTDGGRRACTHTVIQALELGWHGDWITQDAISKIVGYPTKEQGRKGQGLLGSQVTRIMERLKLPYKVSYGLSPQTVIDMVEQRAPAMFAAAYSHQPEWQGYRYVGLVADGKPNGFARPLGKAGKNQLAGFDGGHAEILYGVNRDGWLMIHDPNHNSSARPEEPPLTLVSRHQFAAMFNAYRAVSSGGVTYAFLPTRRFSPP
jgi:hypothetical protein